MNCQSNRRIYGNMVFSLTNIALGKLKLLNFLEIGNLTSNCCTVHYLLFY